MRNVASALIIAVLFAADTAAQAQSGAPTPDPGYVGQMTEEQVRQKLAGEGFAQISDIKKIEVKRYRWTAKAVRNGQKTEVTVDERGHVTAK
jgi:Peptidase propeptide and YPEB domain